MPADSVLADPKLVLVFAQAKTGLGHLRVTDALYHGLPRDVHTLLLNSQDASINYIHQITSRIPVFRELANFTQHGLPEQLFTHFFRNYLRHNTKILEDQLETILEQHVTYPTTLLVVATHYGLAHQLAAIKERFAQKYHVKVVLVVIVTDDSPQKVWAVGGADLIFVPSERTKLALEQYHKSQSLKPAHYVVLPYMVSPRLGKRLTRHQVYARRGQLNPGKSIPIHMAIPISGAAVQLTYFTHFLAELRHKSNRFAYHIVAKQSPLTQQFLGTLVGQKDIDLIVSTSDRDVIDLYEKMYLNEVIALEITKPSEQSFKALFAPNQRGGSVLLFSEPVGRQEYDNVDFLIRHDLLPTRGQQQELWNLALLEKPISEDLLMKARFWRALRLPFRSAVSARFVWWAHQQGLLEQMGQFTRFKIDPELSSEGVHMFWERIGEYLRQLAL